MLAKKVAIVGRPNVGKSTLFNRLVGKKVAIVADFPGVTRDWRELPAHFGDLEFTLFDTAGLDGFEQTELADQIFEQTRKVIQKADILIFMMDAREGLLASDEKIARLLREAKKPCVFLANKLDTRKGQEGFYEAYSLGLGDPISFSASQGWGMAELYEKLRSLMNPSTSLEEGGDEVQEEAETEAFTAPEEINRPLQLAIVGRPNAGKSTLVNRLIGEERLLTGDQPGVTRDSIEIEWDYAGHPIRLVDTAGIRRRSRVEDDLEKASLSETFRAIQFAQVVILVLDATSPLDKQDLVIASKVIEEGRALVLAVNKWDLVEPQLLEEIEYRLNSTLSQVRGIPCVPISALRGENLPLLMEEVLKMYEAWNIRIPTARLNQWLQEAVARHPAPLSGARRHKLKYMAQIKTRPPTYALFLSKGSELPESYLRYLMNSLRESFNLPGVPIRIYLRKSENPYDS